MTLDRSLAITTAALLAVVLAISCTIVVSSGRQRLDESKASEMQTTALLLTTAMAQAASLSQTHADQIARSPEVKTLMRSGDRAGLQALMQPIYANLSSVAGVDMLHFHTSDIHSFLRVQDPGNFGQDLSGFRPMILAANRSRNSQKGLEVGLAGLSLRAVSAIVDGDSVIGTVEVGIDLKSLLDLAKSASGADFALYLSPDMAGIGAKNKQAAPGDGSLEIESSTDSALFQSLYRDGQIRLAREPVQGSARINGEELGTYGQPLLDYSGRMIGTIIIARNFSGLDSGLDRSILTACAVALGGLLIGFAVIMVSLRAMLIRPLADLTAHAQALAAGTGDPDAPATSSRPEIADLRRAIDRLAASRDPGAGSHGIRA
ncbi:HAMP domain-containing protein [Rhizobium sp. CG5]|uniref:cache domain-containing protein n=1 Tax=Rhizobium sp. CG5 TaxID=2726076 RepID=UPI00203327F6|nr:cache domain-containing protein [Rhizobium sp. CG5]MCM2476868.1 HAMP domain-containing protein [Rhizobium sp. CG5]